MPINVDLEEDELRAVLAVIDSVSPDHNGALGRAEFKLDLALLDYETNG